MALTKLRGDYSSLTILSIILSLLLPISTAMSELLPAVDRHVDWRTEMGRVGEDAGPHQWCGLGHGAHFPKPRV